MNYIQINKDDKFKDIYNRYFRSVSSDKIYIGNGNGGDYTLKDFMDKINKEDFIKTLKTTQEHYDLGEGMYYQELDKIINKLEKYKAYRKDTVLSILFEYNKMIEDSEEYICFHESLWDKFDSRLYSWFAINHE